MMNKIVGEGRVKLEVYEECKYTMSADAEIRKVNLNGVVGFEVASGERAKEIEAVTDGSCIDEYHEYLVLYFGDGNIATYRNSYVDMFLR